MTVISRRQLLNNLYMVHAAMLHIVWGIMLLLSEEPTKTTPIHQLTYFVPNRHRLGALLIILSIIILVFKWKSWRIRMMVHGLQTVMILLSALGPVLAVTNSHYADLEIRPRAFIFSDQVVMIMFAAFYIVAIILQRRSDNGSFKPS